MLILILVLLLVSDVFGIAGQIFYKKALNKVNTKKYLDFLKRALSSPLIWLGFFSIAINIIVGLAAVSLGQLSFVNSLDSMDYVLLLFASRLFLGEKIDRDKLIGTILVVIGIVFVAMS